MPTIHNIIKQGYYPTGALSLGKVLDKCFDIKKNTYMLDPCCGDGRVLNLFKKKYSSNCYGIEINKANYQKAIGECNDVLYADALIDVNKSNKWTSILYLNPPYMEDGKKGRLEWDFLDKYCKTIIDEGYLIYVVNKSSLKEEVKKILKRNNASILYSIYDKNNEDYRNFNQIFLIFKIEPQGKVINQNYDIHFDSPTELEDVILFSKEEPPIGIAPKIFNQKKAPQWQIDNWLKKKDIHKRFINNLRKEDYETQSIDHLNEIQHLMLLSSNLQTKHFIDDNGDEILIKGTSVKKKNEEIQYTENKSKQIITDYYTTEMYGFNIAKGFYFKLIEEGEKK